MKTLTNRAFIAAAILAAATYLVGYGQQKQDTNGKYAEVNGLKMYYEIHGSGRPLVLLHGAFGFAEGWAPYLPALSKTHQVIAVELQGHG
ncbi:MAG TPA: alpha/beta hydrolase, partial [Blastocatellia bacterium]|nr:alpha/beta hydrolase [Blastocatellia bacterium]